MFKHPKVVPITAAKRDSTEQLRKETIPSIPPGTVTRMPLRPMLAAARNYETQILKEKGDLLNGAHAPEADPLHAQAQL
jgi:hypothetical protein